MKKISIVYLFGAVVLLGSCAREYPTFNQMPKNVHVAPKAATTVEIAAVEAPAEAVEVVQPITMAEISKDEKVMEMLAQKTPQQLDEQLETALASTKGQELMANPLIASRINKARAVLTKLEAKQVDPSAVAGSAVVTKMVDKQLSKSMAPAAAKAIDGKVTAGLILVLLGIVLGLIPGVGWLIGGIVTAIGVVILVLGLID
ncbi:hypothetical protein [Persicitalea sp.]|uniref:hypothetical protein n=1 Tax=Persicitalea sp. TaxID=3100273 RepID=UPI0035937727